MIEVISNAIIPIIILIVIIYGIYKRINIYDVFIDGAKESIDMSFNLFPSMLAMIFLKVELLNGCLIIYIFLIFQMKFYQ